MSVGCHCNLRETMIEFVVISIVTVFAILFYIGADQFYFTSNV